MEFKSIQAVAVQSPRLKQPDFSCRLGSSCLRRAGAGLFLLPAFLYNTECTTSQEKYRDGRKVRGVNQELQERKSVIHKIAS